VRRCLGIVLSRIHPKQLGQPRTAIPRSKAV
jgi:hypothetical protein